MLIPSRTLRNQLLTTSQGIFFETINFGERIDLVAKLPSDIIEGIVSGMLCYLSYGEFFLSTKQLVFYTAFAVEDDPPSMFYLSRTHQPSDVDLIAQFLTQIKMEFHIFDEFNRNVVSFTINISPISKPQADNLRRTKPAIAELTKEQIEIALDYLDSIFSGDSSILRSLALKLEEPKIPQHIQL